MPKKVVFVLALCLLVLSGRAFAVAAAPGLTELSLEELMNVEITSVSKTPQVLSRTAAAVHVISNEEIRRSGAATIPDLLRLVPGVQVVRIDANKWAVSVRGFNDRFTNNLLVLMDGRILYDPLFSGTHWDIQDTPFEDIDRIEVIRGPGGTIWGSNAVNGVINIITKSAKDTQGGYVSGGGGDKERAFGEFRYGGKAGDVPFRVYSKYTNRDDSPQGHDEWYAARAGGRADWDNGGDTRFTLQGDGYEGQMEATITRWFRTAPLAVVEDVREDASGGNVMGRMVREFNEKSDLQAQMYYDYTFRGSAHVELTRHTADLDVQYRFPAFDAQEVIVGGGYRVSWDETVPSLVAPVSVFIPADRHDDVWSWFVQDEITLIEDLLTLTIGSKFEVNDYTGFEYQPSASLAYFIDDKSTLWGSVTRAVRVPTPADVHSVTEFPSLLVGATTVTTRNRGQDEFKAEEIISYESGFRTQFYDKVSVDLASFYSEYRDLRTAELYGQEILNPFPTRLIQNVSLENNLEARTYGGELSLNYFVTKDWRLSGGYTYLYMHLTPGPTSDASEGVEKRSPRHSAFAQSFIQLPWNWQLDSAIRYVDELRGLNVKSYVVADVRLAWQPRPDWELSLAARNLFATDHLEYIQPLFFETFGLARRVESSVYGKVTVKF